MATLTLDRVWLNLLPTGEALSARSAPDRSRGYEGHVEVRTYAGGRQRAIIREGLPTQFACTLRLLTWAQVETLISWIGRTVQVRDHRGTRYFGVFGQVTPVEIPNEPTLWDAQIAVRVVTTDEGV